MSPDRSGFLLHQLTGSYALAGATAALVAAGDAASTSFQGRLIDRAGRGRVLIPTAAVHVIAVTALLLLAWTHGPAWALAASAAVAGVGMPPVSGSIKAVWPQLAGACRLADAYTIESLLQQIIFLIGRCWSRCSMALAARRPRWRARRGWCWPATSGSARPRPDWRVPPSAGRTPGLPGGAGTCGSWWAAHCCRG